MLLLPFVRSQCGLLLYSVSRHDWKEVFLAKLTHVVVVVVVVVIVVVVVVAIVYAAAAAAAAAAPHFSLLTEIEPAALLPAVDDADKPAPRIVVYTVWVTNGTALNSYSF